MIRLVAIAVLALALPCAALASAVVESFHGDVRVGGAQVQQGQRIFPGATVATGEGAQLVMRFDDGSRIVLHQRTDFRVVDFGYVASDPAQDRSIFDLLRGALRVVTGAVARRSRDTFALRAPQATIGIRGTDFMVAVVNPAYVQVISGAVGVANAGGTVVLGAGAAAQVASSAALAVQIAPSALPPAASGAFGSLSAVKVSAAPGLGGASAGVQGGAAATAGAATFPAPMLLTIGAAAAAAAAASSAGDSTVTHDPSQVK